MLCKSCSALLRYFLPFNVILVIEMYSIITANFKLSLLVE